ncbi:MAG: pitrilysin family protein [Candidatus Buchananbacteria bacterium]
MACSKAKNFKALKSGNCIYSHRPTSRQMTFGFVINSGSIYDGEKRGLHHLTEHITASAVNDPERSTILENLEMHGGSFNAETSPYQTMYFCTVPADFAKLAIDTIKALINNFSAGLKDLSKHKKVTIREYELHQQDYAIRFDDEFMSYTFGADHPYGAAIGGTPKSIEAIQIEDIEALWKTKYAPDNLLFIATGNFKLEEITKNLIEVSTPATPPATKIILPTPQIKTQFIKEDDFWQEANISIASLPTPYKNIKELCLAEILCSMLSDGFSSPLLIWRENSGLFYECSFAYQIYPDFMQLLFQSHTDPSNKDRLIEGFWRIYNATITNEQRFKFAVNRCINESYFYNEDPEDLWDDAAEELGCLNRVIPLSEKVNLMHRIKLEEVQKLANDRFSQNNTYTFICKPR